VTAELRRQDLDYNLAVQGGFARDEDPAHAAGSKLRL
jgi:hypothetical protein